MMLWLLVLVPVCHMLLVFRRLHEFAVGIHVCAHSDEVWLGL